ncbi:MAG TPA: hypothetical protein VG692_18445 [Gemmatimonadales bacterium]|nr:hypothetical protein [Gemmatimonadales bacterium]
MIRSPIIIDARGALLVYNSLTQALRDLTVQDVREGRYPVAYDAEGRLLRIEVRTRERKILGLWREVREEVHIVAYEHIPTHEMALRELLLRYIQPAGHAGLEFAHPFDGLLRMVPARAS